MVPALKNNSLMSARKFLGANYIKVLTSGEVLIYYRNEVKLRTLGSAIIKGWICKTNGLWRDKTSYRSNKHLIYLDINV